MLGSPGSGNSSFIQECPEPMNTKPDKNSGGITDLLQIRIPMSWWVLPSSDPQPSMERGFSGMRGSDSSRNSPNGRNWE